MKEVHRLDEKLYHIATLLEGILISQNREFSEDHYGMSPELMGLWRKRLYRELFTEEEQADFARGLLEANPRTLGFSSYLEAEQCVRKHDNTPSVDAEGREIIWDLFDYVAKNIIRPVFEEARKTVSGLRFGYNESGRYVLMISEHHSLKLSLSLCPRPLVIIGGGTVRDRGVRVSEINRKFTEDLVKEFLGAIRKNNLNP